MVDSFVVKDNPLFEHRPFPAYDRVKPKHVLQICEFLTHLENELVKLEKTDQSIWPEMVETLAMILYRLDVVWGIVEHLKTVKETRGLRFVFKKVQPKVVEFKMRVKQSKPIYDRLVFIKDRCSEAHKHIVESWIKSAILGGVNLDAEKRDELNIIEKRLKQLSQNFEDNVRDATNKFEKLIKDKKETIGLSPAVLKRASQIAKSKGYENATVDNGPWMITLNASIFDDVINNSENQNLRIELTLASLSLASSGDHNNIPIIDEILKLRINKAKLLGCKNYAELSMKDKMATFEEAHQLMDELCNAYREVAVEDLKKLQKFCTASKEPAELNDLDIAFWQSKFCGKLSKSTPCGKLSKSVEDEALEYFSWPYVREGLFNLSKILFGIDIGPANNLAPVWHRDVEFYRVCDSSRNPIAYFYVDPYARPPKKEDGAWTVGVFDRSSAMSRDKYFARLPIVHLVYNLTPPTRNTPSLLTFEQVVTVFHEFGHALQRILTKQDEGLVFGVQEIEWDAVELPSMFMEKWCYHKDTLMSIGKHYNSKKSIPESLCMDLLKNVDLFKGLVGLQQVRMGILDLQLHTLYNPDGSKTALDFSKSVYKITSVYPMLQEDKYLCSLSHIFTDEYAAGYYGYQWSEMMAVDVFSAFEVAGLNDKEAMKDMGHKFRETILAFGSGNAAKEIFKKFKGKEHSSKEMLKQIRKSLPEELLKPSSSKSSPEHKRRKKS